MSTPSPPLDRVRLDVFLDVACIMPTRSQAGRVCAANRVEVNGEIAKAHRLVKVGDAIRIHLKGSRFPDERRSFLILEISNRQLSKIDARKLVEETTPVLSAEEIAERKLVRATKVARPKGLGRPTKRERRDIERLRS